MDAHAPAADLAAKGRLLECLPPSYRDALAAEGAAHLAAIRSLLLSGIQLLDGRMLSKALRELHQFVDLKYEFPRTERAFLAQQCLAAIPMTNYDISLQGKLIHAASTLLAKKELEAVVAWEPLFSLIEALTETSRSAPYSGAAGPATRVRSLATLVKHARRYFPAGSAAAIWKRCEPLFCPYDGSCLLGQALVVTFMPLEDLASQQQLLDRIMAIWPWIDCSFRWDSAWLTLVARLAKRSGAALNFDAHLPMLFTVALRSLDITLGNSALPHPSARFSPVEASLLLPLESETTFRKIGKLIANLLSPQRKTQEYLDQFFRSIGTYYHPSNGGSWSGKLAALTLGIIKSFAMRLAREKNAPASPHHLGDGERRNFATTLLSVLTTAQYSKNADLVYSAEQALKHLAYIVPDMVLPFQVERAYNSLTNITATHATLSAFETLANIVHPLVLRNNYPAGAASVLDLMFAALPGIDPNDGSKTNAALKFYFALFSSMPLGDVSRSPVTAESDFDQRAKEATAQFGDFTLQLLERTFAYLSQKSKPEKKPAYAARLAASLIPRFATSLFAQMSPALHKEALAKLKAYVNENILPNAQKEFGFLIEAASLAQPAPTLAAFVPSLCAALLQSDTELAASSDEETAWRIHMLAAAVKRTGTLLLPHIARLRSVIRLAVYDQRKEVQKEGTKLLRAVLFSLSHTYPTDYRAWDPALHKSSGEKDPWLHWGRRYTWKEADVQWHLPTSEEVKAAAELTSEMGAKALARLSELAAQPTLNIPRPELHTYIALLSGLVRSAALLLPEDVTDVIARHELEKDGDENDEANTADRPYQLPLVLNAPATAFAAEVAVLANWREKLHRLCHSLVQVFSEHRKEDIRGAGMLIKLIGRALFTRGARPTRIEVRLKFNKMMLDKHRTWATKPLRHFRYDLVSAAYLRHMQRVMQRGDFVPFTRTVKALIHDLADLSLSQYSEVRQTAQTRLQWAVKHFPMATVPLVKNFIRILPQSGIPDEKITGAAYTLMIKTFLRRVWRDWRLLSDFVLALCATHIHSKVTHQSRLFQLFAVFASGFYQLPIALPPPDTKGPASASAVEQERQWKQRASERNHTNWLATVNGLLGMVQKPDLHWRYGLMASCALFFLIRDDQPMPTGVYTWFAKCLTAELPSMRTLGTKAVYVLLNAHKPRAAKSEAPVTAGDVYAWLNSGPFHDKNYLGWSGQLTHVTVTRTPAAQTVPVELFAQLGAGATIESVVNLMALDHRVKDENVSASSEVSRLVAGVAFMLGAQSNLDSKDVADELIRRLVKVDYRSWPKVSSTRHSTQFQVLNARLFHRLYQVYGAQLVDAFEPHIAKHFAAAEEGEQCAVAEFVCGVLRGLLVCAEGPETERVRSFVVKAMQEAVLNRQLTIEMITMWGTGLRFAVYDYDRRRYQWLLDLFIRDALHEVQASFALSAAKRLYFIRSLLLELTWRGADVARDYLVSLRPLLAHPYKQARLEISQLLYFSVVSLAFPPAGASVSPVVSETLKFLLGQAQAYADLGSEVSEEKAKERSSWRDSVVLFLQSLFRHFSGASHPHFAECVAILLHCQNDVDTDVSKTAKAALALAAQASAKSSELRELDAVLSQFGRSASWHVRQALLPFLQLLAFDHQFLHTDLAAIREFAVAALTDAHVEVRELASHSLSSLLRVVPAAEAKQLTTRFAKLAATPLSKAKGPLTPEESAARLSRHAGVLGLIALVHTQPYELPDWMVDTLLLLARHSNDPSPISTSVRRAFAEFFRTHQDMWHVHKEKFTRDDLYTINQLILSPSYYA